MDDSKIKEILQMYFDGCCGGDPEKIKIVFHNPAHIYGHGDDGKLTDWSKDDFVKRVGSNNPALLHPGFPRQDEILSIDFTGEKTAVAKVKIRIGNNLYTDILSFMQLDGKWGIISKLFSKVPAV